MASNNDFLMLQAQSQSAKNQMAFQERMSNTAHQREVEDLKAAGLNPVLSSHGSGASTPVGASGDITGLDLSGIVKSISSGTAKTVESVSKSLSDVIYDAFHAHNEQVPRGLNVLRDRLSGRVSDFDSPSVFSVRGVGDRPLTFSPLVSTDSLFQRSSPSAESLYTDVNSKEWKEDKKIISAIFGYGVANKIEAQMIARNRTQQKPFVRKLNKVSDWAARNAIYWNPGYLLGQYLFRD